MHGRDGNEEDNCNNRIANNSPDAGRVCECKCHGKCRQCHKGINIHISVQHRRHEKIDTTLNYAMVKQSNVKMAQKKLMS